MLLTIVLTIFFSGIQSAIVRDTWSVEQWVVDYKRPTIDIKGFWPWQDGAERVSPYDMDEEVRKSAFLINGQYPGPAFQCNVGDQVEITVVNKLLSSVISIHWHGQHQPGTPYMDGAGGISQYPIMPGQNFTYKFTASPAGTHYYHAHMDAVQTAKGIRGAFIVHDPNDPFLNMYQDERIVVVSDEWRDPEVCLYLEGAMPGNDVCADIHDAGFNGQVGDGSDAYPYPLITVSPGVCYRMRFIFPGSNTENFLISIAGHNMTLIAVDGVLVRPIQITSFNLHLGERYDVVLCADQEPGNYLINATYDYACTLTAGNFIPPGFSPVPSCMFYGFLNYKGHTDIPREPKGTGGGANPQPTSGVNYDLNHFEAWQFTQPYEPSQEPEQPDVRYVINMGLLGPTYDGPTNKPLSHGRWYMDLQEENPPRTWHPPSTPLYMTKGKCGVGNIPIINIPENATTVELVINNLSPAAHVIHFHGTKFSVINYANYFWCGVDYISCFLLPWWVNECPPHKVKVGDPNNPNLEFGGYWGCTYDPDTDSKTQNLNNPIRKDMIQVWQRSWAVIRFKATNPGFWMFHCHMEQHIPLGMNMVFNILPSKQPPIPGNLPHTGC